jgi:hypothetical protein
MEIQLRVRFNVAGKKTFEGKRLLSYNTIRNVEGP